jgi:pantoate--beta-alanine ligase
MIVTPDIEAIRAFRAQHAGTVGLVPTMGALHDGHLSLVRNARADHDWVIVTIFVNPTQFAPHEDLDRYPRDLPADLAKLEALGVDVVFTPTPDTIYPPNFQTYVTVEEVTQGLEGAKRPTHFRGVTTVVAKLFNITQPDSAYFGQKDAQQVVVIRQMVRDLNIPVEIVVIPTQREADGLAMSSRNVYLTPEQRQASIVLRRALDQATSAYQAGERDAQKLATLIADVVGAEGLAELDDVAVVDAGNLSAVEHADAPLLAVLTVRFGQTRLLDNALLPPELNTREGLTGTLGAG